MIKAFCPGHITCFFAPVITDDVMTTGSVGAGIRLNKGVTVTIEGRASNRRTRITMDGESCQPKISEHVAGALGPDKNFDITIENDLPISQGLGMSAAGALALALCITSLKNLDEHDAHRAAHIAEIENGGGLGDVAGIIGGRQPVRIKAGLPPFGRTIDTGLDMRMSVIVLGPRMDTGNILADPEAMRKVSEAGVGCVNRYIAAPSERALYDLSAEFSRSVGLESKKVRRALSDLRIEHMASMCMLGNSIFTDAEEDQIRDMLGDVDVISCASGSTGPAVIRKE
ncbi:MAG: pantothenate kinase [Methanomassiliicoccaceae archaeon]|jgi:pantoate kinase|nr:pantothenate kinase [Methanomassiliicoccaceae archaeon]